MWYLCRRAQWIHRSSTLSLCTSPVDDCHRPHEFCRNSPSRIHRRQHGCLKITIITISHDYSAMTSRKTLPQIAWIGRANVDPTFGGRSTQRRRYNVDPMKICPSAQWRQRWADVEPRLGDSGQHLAKFRAMLGRCLGDVGPTFCQSLSTFWTAFCQLLANLLLTFCSPN